MKLTPITVKIRFETEKSKPTVFEDRLGPQSDRKIASSQVDGQGMRLSAIRLSTQQDLVLWQLEDGEGNKLAGILSDLDVAIREIKEQL